MKYLVSIIAFCTMLSANGQYNRELSPSNVNCVEVGFQSLEAICELYDKGRIDSLRDIFYYLSDECGTNYYTDFLHILLSIDDHELNVNTYPALLETMLDYSQRAEEDISGRASGRYYEYALTAEQYYDFLKAYSADLGKNPFLEDSYKEVLQFFSGEYDQVIKALKNGESSVPRLQNDFDSIRKALVVLPEYSTALFAGYWIPQSNLATTLGNHLEVGAQLGYLWNKNQVNWVLAARFSDTESEYRVKKNDSIYSTTEFLGFHTTLDYGRSLYRDLRQDFAVRAGLGVEGITVARSDEERDLDAVEIYSFNMNLGMAYRWYFKNEAFSEISFRYHFLNYVNSLDDTFDGNALTLRLVVGLAGYDKPKRAFVESMRLRN